MAIGVARIAVIVAMALVLAMAPPLGAHVAHGQSAQVRLAFVGPDGNVWLDDLAGNRMHITDDARKGQVAYDTPVWSPEGNRLLVVSGTAN